MWILTGSGFLLCGRPKNYNTKRNSAATQRNRDKAFSSAIWCQYFLVIFLLLFGHQIGNEKEMLGRSLAGL